MFLDPALIPNSLLWVSCALAVAVLLPCLRYAHWSALWAVPLRQHLLFGSLLFLVVLWLISVRMFEGLWLHFLGITTVTLLLGWRFTVLIGAIACCIHALLIQQSLAGAPLAWILSVLVPATLSRGLVYWLRQRPQSNLFVYLLGAGFGGGVLASIGLCVTGLIVLALIGQGDRVSAALEAWPMVTLIAFPEGFMNGMVLSVIVVLNPEAVKTFDSDKYLGEGED